MIRAAFCRHYQELEIIKNNPFATIDQAGVGKLMEMACDLGRKTRPDIKLGICGEHGGDPESVKFCHRIGLSYVSCSPFRVPVARLAAAQAALRSNGEAESADARPAGLDSRECLGSELAFRRRDHRRISDLRARSLELLEA